jgi:hypothetical protein
VLVQARPRQPEWGAVSSGYRFILAHPPGGGLLTRMFVPGAKIPLPLGFLPSPCQKAPSGSAWVHEIKHDGYRLMARRDGNQVRSFTRRGYDWSGKYPWIVDALRLLRVRCIIVDGEAVWAGQDGKSDFDKLHSGAHDASVFLYGFDLIELDGEDLRSAPLEQRKGKLEKLLARRSDSLLRASRRRWRDDLRARMQAWTRRHRLEAPGPALPLRAMQGLDHKLIAMPPQRCAATQSAGCGVFRG